MVRRFLLLALLVLLAGCSTHAAVVSTPAPDPAASAAPDGGLGVDLAFEARERPASRPPPVADPTPLLTPLPTPSPDPQLYALNLFEEGDFVPQYTFDWCVAASIQMAYNMATDESRTARADQQQIWERARELSSSSFNGANPRGWTAVLNELGIGPYELVSVPDYHAALRAAAGAIHATQRPVGLVMWRGRHAWVMNGFESLGDPSVHADFQVTGIRVSDPLYPYGSGTWGPSPSPNSLLTPAELAKQFVIRDSRRWSNGMPAGYLMVLPVLAEVAVVRAPLEVAA